ncbi:hypothetical protein QUA43_13515 [Microcoleus sp. N9_B4]|uniref:hypothetical protein n=1 Tax=Microcoleus sp. N9_B4 TaxID=3055386 RepID=UPI002FD0DCC9
MSSKIAVISLDELLVIVGNSVVELESIEALPPLPLLQLESMPVLPQDTSPSERGRAAFTASGS